MPNGEHRWSTAIEAARDLGPVVYFARTRDGLIKIGYTTQIHTRRHGLGIRWEDVLVVMAGTPADERACHILYAKHLARGREYFHPHPDLLDHINAMRAGHHMPPIEFAA